MKEKVYYYSDELNDDFAGITRDTITVDENFKYFNNNIIYKCISAIIYNVMKFFSYIYYKIKYNLTILNRDIVKDKNNVILYGNHTNLPGDGFFPSFILNKKPTVIVNADNISLKGTKNLMMMIGAFPIPNKINGFKNFKEALKKLNNIIIYPEAHIWPYYTKIRNFKDVSFKYPLELNKEVYSFTVTYKKRKYTKIPKIVIYVDGPFKENDELSLKENKKYIRDMVYNKMKERAKNSDIEVIKYIKKEE